MYDTTIILNELGITDAYKIYYVLMNDYDGLACNNDIIQMLNIDSNIINEILDPINESLFNDNEIEYLAFINYTIESSDIFLDNSIFNYDSYYEKFNLLDKLVDIKYLTVEELTYYSLLDYDEILELAYDMFNIPANISIYIDDNKVIRDYVLSYYDISHTAPNNYNFNESDLFLIRV